MSLDTDAEIIALRTVLRDLVALSAIPAGWIGREPGAVAAGLADTLIGLLRLDFVAVRLRDLDVGETVDAVRGDASTIPEWLEAHLAGTVRPSSAEIVDAHVAPCRGVMIPIGVDADRGLVAAVSDRDDFPTEVDQLLLRFAANQAATAFQNACLIHERKKAQEELREMQRLRVKEEERERIARDIHDDTLQSLGAIALRLGMLGKRAADEGERRSIAGLVELTRDSAEHLRSLVFDLRADVLEQGLAQALRSYVFEGPTPLPFHCRIESHLGTEPPMQVGLVLYRVAQEALTNVRKHAGARSARVSLDEVGVGIRLRVRDDGCGFDFSAGGRAPGHIGLRAMRERADLAGGRLSMETSPGLGTTVQVWIPVDGMRPRGY